VDRGEIQAEVSAIASSLNRLFEELQQSEDSLLRTSSKNVIILLTDAHWHSYAEEVLQVVTQVNPARIFFVHCDPKLSKIDVSVSALCHGLSKEEHICSEVIRISTPTRESNRVPFLLRANALSGVATDLFLIGPIADAESTSMEQPLRPYLRLCESVFFDSNTFPNQFRFLSAEFGSRLRFVDLQWLRLASWREAVSQLFAVQGWALKLTQLSRIELNGTLRQGEESSAALMLMAGWLLSRLDFEVTAFGARTFECQARDGRSLQIVLDTKKEPAQEATLTQMRFIFSPESDIAPETVIFARRDAQVAPGVNPGLWRAVAEEDERISEILSRFFLVGESIKSYTGAAKVALELENLRRGYSFTGMS